MFPSSLTHSAKLSGGRMPEFFRRAAHAEHMEFDSALNQMWLLLTQPSAIFKLAKVRKMTKNHYYRDDPAFIVLQVFFLAVTTIAFGLALHAPFARILYNVIYQCGVNYIVVGALFSSAMWAGTNRFLLSQEVQLNEVRREVEWQYCWDVHCNAYVPFFAWTHVAHLFLLPIVIRSNFGAQLIANVLYAVGITAYFFATFRGYVELPMLERQQLLLYPVVGAVSLLILATITTHLNMSHAVMHYAWPAGGLS